ncbi:MAG TPA: hypothetical protein VF705_09200 [Longimicrobium sp.]
MASEPRSATDLVKAAAAALEAQRWADIVPLVHPDSLASFKEAQLRRLRRDEEFARAAAGSDEIRPGGNAAAHEAVRAGEARALPRILAEWGVRSSFRELEDLAPADFLERFLAATSPGALARITLAVHDPSADAGAFRDKSPQRQIIVLGEVLEGSSTAHVLYREVGPGEEYDPDSPQGVVLITEAHLRDSRWWLRVGQRGLLERPSVVWANFLSAQT